MRQRIIIFGAGGFIGGWLSKKFKKETSFEVLALTKEDCNLLSRESCGPVLADVTNDDVVIFASAITRLKENSFQAMQQNIQMAGNLIQSMDNRPLRQMIFLSSVDVYGLVAENVYLHENVPVNPNDYYAIGKFACEQILRQYCTRHGIGLTILRLSGIYGPGDDGKSNINRIARSALQDGKICVWGDGDDVRDYVWVNDLYRIIEQAVRRNLSVTVNIATGKSHCVRAMAQLISAALLQNCPIEFAPQNALSRNKTLNFDITFLKKTFPGFYFKDVREGIEEYAQELQNYCENVVGEYRNCSPLFKV